MSQIAAIVQQAWQNLVTGLAVLSSLRQPFLLPIVDLGYATYQGTVSNDQHVFQGMRYAKPPLGDLRWRAASYPPDTVTGTQNATEFGNACHPVGIVNATTGFSEDCLFVNVWAPAERPQGGLLPVLFYIHGGGYVADSSNGYPGDQLLNASGNTIVYVSINYRLAQFGFLGSSEIAADGDLNVGLLDQYIALTWVSEHISKFGGDPAQVTIWGESAGAGSVAMQLLGYGGTSNLFRAAVGDSVYLPFMPRASDGWVQEQFQAFATLAGCGGAGNNTLTCLRGMPESVLVLAGSQTQAAQGSFLLFEFGPVVDGTFLTDYAIKSFLEGNFKKVPTIMGYNNNEGSTFAPLTDNDTSQVLDQFVTNQFPNITANTIAEINAVYPPSAYNDSLAYNSSTIFGRAAAVYGEATFICQVPLIGFAQANAKGQSYSYRFNRTDTSLPEGFGTIHGAELSLFFGYPTTEPNDPAYGALVNSMQAYLISFVRTMDPNALKLAGDPAWPDANGGTDQLLLQEGSVQPEVMPPDLVSRCQFWWNHGDEMQR